MPIPDYEMCMLPLLAAAEDGKDHRIRDLTETLADQFGLTEEERRQLLPRGEPRFRNRVGWARTYLVRAGLLQSTARGVVQITHRGLAVLAKKPEKIDNAFLNQFAEFKDFKDPSRTVEPDSANTAETNGRTPEELLEASYQTLRASLAAELLDRVRKMPPSGFEQLVVDLLVAMGYGGSVKDAGQTVGGTGDGGIDGIIKEDSLGLDLVCIQAKRWTDSVGRPVVQAFAGSLLGRRARKGVLITTSRFTSDALDFVKTIEQRIVLIDGQQLAQLMIDHNIAVTGVASYTIKRLDSDYFSEE